jgi:hypothetical protein
MHCCYTMALVSEQLVYKLTLHLSLNDTNHLRNERRQFVCTVQRMKRIFGWFPEEISIKLNFSIRMLKFSISCYRVLVFKGLGTSTNQRACLLVDCIDH